MINFIIPGLYELNQLNINLLYLLKYCPFFFEDNIKIGAVFGAFQYNIWDGGRVFNSYQQASKENIEFLKNIYNEKFNIPMRFIFTNSLITEEDCKDHFNNMVLEICHNELNEVVVVSPILQKYIKTNYPKYKIISSTTKCLTNIDQAYSEILNKEYFMTCLDYNLNKNWDFLNSIPKEDRNKVEILINAICPPGCPYRKEHYKLNSIYSLSYGKNYQLPGCNITRNTLSPLNEKGNNLSKADIYNKYSQQGFINFKIEGRTLFQEEVALNYVKYMVKDQFKELVTYYLLLDTKILLKKFNISLEV